MSKKKTHEQFVTELKECRGNEYKPLSKYLGVHNEIKIKHTKCGHEFITKPVYIMKKTTKTPCPICSGNQPLTREQFDQRVKDAVGDEYIFLGEYVKLGTKMLCRHSKCGYEWYLRPQDFFDKKKPTRCPKCMGVPRYTLDDAKQVFAEKGLTLLAEKYEGSTKPMPFICNTHTDKGIQYKSLHDLTRTRSAYGCRYCGWEVIAKKNLEHTTITDLRQDYLNHGLELLENEYRGINEPYLCRCLNDSTHGTSYVKYQNVKYATHGLSYCPHCMESAKSKGEFLIRKFLLANSITYEEPKTFEGLEGVGGGLLSYDFFLPNDKILIEFQGQQHEKAVEMFGGNVQFEKQQEHDKRKTEYAKKNGYRLIEIWYYDMDNVSDILSELLLEKTVKAVS